MANTPEVTELLDAAVTALGGRRREGQVTICLLYTSDAADE